MTRHKECSFLHLFAGRPSGIIKLYKGVRSDSFFHAKKPRLRLRTGEYQVNSTVLSSLHELKGFILLHLQRFDREECSGWS